MATYELKLYKRSTFKKSQYIFIRTIRLEAESDDAAAEKARTAGDPTFGDSDLAILFNERGDIISQWSLLGV